MRLIASIQKKGCDVSKALPKCECGARNWTVVSRYKWRTITLRCDDCGKEIKSHSKRAFEMSMEKERKEKSH